MKINTGSLPLGIREFSFNEDTKIVGLDDRFTGRIDVSVRVEKTGQMIELQATMLVTANLTCDRCADDILKDIKASYRMIYFFREANEGGLPDDTVVVLPSENTVIDITDDIRQYTLLTVPLKVLCKGDCLGLCPSCGINLNATKCSCSAASVDPRWEQLSKLLKQN